MKKNIQALGGSCVVLTCSHLHLRRIIGLPVWKIKHSEQETSLGGVRTIEAEGGPQWFEPGQRPREGWGKLAVFLSPLPDHSSSCSTQALPTVYYIRASSSILQTPLIIVPSLSLCIAHCSYKRRQGPAFSEVGLGPYRLLAWLYTAPLQKCTEYKRCWVGNTKVAIPGKGCRRNTPHKHC